MLNFYYKELLVHVFHKLVAYVTIFLLPLTHKLMVLIDNHWLEIKNWEYNKRLSIYLSISVKALFEV